MIETTEPVVEERRKGPLALAIIGGLLVLVAGWALKEQCTRHAWDGYQYRHSCYNDIYALYFFRGLDRQAIPYVTGDGVLADSDEVGDLEYPVGTGIFVAAMALIADDAYSFFEWSALGLGVAGFVTILVLWRLADRKRRIFFYALAPTVVLYAFHNWDLLAVLLMCLGLLAFRSRMDGSAGVLLGLGAATKLFPGLLIPGLMLSRRREGGRWPIEMLVGAVVSYAALNVPFMVVNLKGWGTFFTFQSERLPNFETIWYTLLSMFSSSAPGIFSFSSAYGRLTGVVSTVLFGLIALFLFRRAGTREPRPFALSFSILLAFLLTAKVFSPQYMLWVVPFFVLVRLQMRHYVAFVIADASVWIAVSWFFLETASHGMVGLTEVVLGIMVMFRYGVIIWLMRAVDSAEENVFMPAPPEGWPTALSVRS